MAPLVDAKPVADAVKMLLPALVMIKSLNVAEPSARVFVVGVPLANVPVLKLIVTGTSLVEMLLLNASRICTTKEGKIWPAVFVATGAVENASLVAAAAFTVKVLPVTDSAGLVMLAVRE